MRKPAAPRNQKPARTSGCAPVSSNHAILSSIVAEVDPADPNAIVRATPSATPFAAKTAFPVSIVAMPPARAALARAVATVNLNKIIAHPTGFLADIQRSGVADRGRRCQEAGGSQNPECIEHFHSHDSSRTTLADAFNRPSGILNGRRVWWFKIKPRPHDLLDERPGSCPSQGNSFAAPSTDRGTKV
jgi:hypothetical protein